MQGSSKHTCKIHSRLHAGTEQMSVFVKQTATLCAFTSSDSWVILSPIEQSIKRKIEAVGTPLRDWNIQINYGIKTGCNEAFIIDEAKRSEILANCRDAAERKRTEQILRPILRGRDIKRYGYDWAGWYLIASHNGIPEKGIKRHAGKHGLKCPRKVSDYYLVDCDTEGAYLLRENCSNPPSSHFRISVFP